MNRSFGHHPPIRRLTYRQRMTRRLIGFVLRVILATLLAWFLYITPVAIYIVTDGAPPLAAQMWWGAFLGFLLVVYIGKSMVDTFFYNRYRP
jgi:hypothetical protein